MKERVKLSIGLACFLGGLLVWFNFDALLPWFTGQAQAAAAPAAKETAWYLVHLPVMGMEFNVLVLLAIGFSVGVLGGFFGMGGAWIVTPGLNIFGFNMAFAIGTDLAHIYGKSIVATIKHSKMGNVDMLLGILLSVGAAIGVEIGAINVMWLERIGKVDVVIRILYMVLLFGLGFYMVYEYFSATRKRKAITTKGTPTTAAEQAGVGQRPGLAARLQQMQVPPMITFKMSGVTISLWVILAVAVVTGWLSGLLGVGGGFIRMPALIYLIGIPTAVAVGTDLFSVIFSGAYGCLTFALKGRVELVAAMWMLLGATVGAQIGVSAVRYIRGYGIRLLFAVMIIVAGLTVLLKQFNLGGAAQVLILAAALAVCLVILVKLIQGMKAERRA
jgi:uncharacterized membrane protein YfcA